jgi:hypothetical protein
MYQDILTLRHPVINYNYLILNGFLGILHRKIKQKQTAVVFFLIIVNFPKFMNPHFSRFVVSEFSL